MGREWSGKWYRGQFWNSLRFGRKVPKGGKQNELVGEELRDALNLNAFHSLNIQVYIPSKTATTTNVPGWDSNPPLIPTSQILVQMHQKKPYL